MKYVIDRKTYEVRYQFLIGNVRRDVLFVAQVTGGRLRINSS